MHLYTDKNIIPHSDEYGLLDCTSVHKLPLKYCSGQKRTQELSLKCWSLQTPASVFDPARWSVPASQRIRGLASDARPAARKCKLKINARKQKFKKMRCDRHLDCDRRYKK